MKFWWVNQNQTAKHEIEGGYMWSPKLNRNGRRNPFYDTMRRVDAGDIVFSFVRQYIKYLGIIQTPAFSVAKPADFGLTGDYWNNEGWYVPVEWYELPVPYQPREHFDQIKPTLPVKYSPLHRETGNGLQNVYLAAVPNAMADVLLALTKGWSQDIVELAATGSYNPDQARDAIDAQIEKKIRDDKELSETVKRSLVEARKGQGIFRRRLTEMENCCRISKVSDPRLLRASHIKPWRSCETGKERLDGNNGLLLAPHIDLLFDQGYISFENNGDVILSGRINRHELAKLGITTDITLNVGRFNPNQCRYLEFHRKEVLLI